MEGHNVNNDMTEIKGMLQQLVACYDNCGMEEDEDAKKDVIKALKKDTDHNFVDFLGVNVFIMQIPKVVVNIVNHINDGEVYLRHGFAIFYEFATLYF
ncbi:hypothetical protein ACLB2K_063493 [Fragaria x ananassa]